MQIHGWEADELQNCYETRTMHHVLWYGYLYVYSYLLLEDARLFSY